MPSLEPSRIRSFRLRCLGNCAESWNLHLLSSVHAAMRSKLPPPDSGEAILRGWIRVVDLRLADSAGGSLARRAVVHELSSYGADLTEARDALDLAVRSRE